MPPLHSPVVEFGDLALDAEHRIAEAEVVAGADAVHQAAAAVAAAADIVIAGEEFDVGAVEILAPLLSEGGGGGTSRENSRGDKLTH